MIIESMEIRDERPGDYEAIRQVIRRAFKKNADEPAAAADVVELLRERKKAVIALVATVQDQVVGHIMFSPVLITEAPEGLRAVGLAPLTVLPEFQNSGIGSRLALEGLGACRRDGYDAVVVLGHPNYYPRFGFSRAMDFHLDNEYGANDSFMVTELHKGVLGTMSGLVKFAPEFREAGC